MKNNIKNKWLVAGAVAALVAFSSTVQAIPITGSVYLDGALTYTANSVSFINPAEVNNSPTLAPTGNFAGIPTGPTGPAVTFLNITSFSPLTPNPVSPLWTFSVGGTVYSFNLTSLTVVQDTASFLSLSGSGTVMISTGGFVATPASWTLTATTTSGTFGFISSNTSVPDGGMTVMLLGVALSGLFLVRKQMLA